MGSGSGWKFMGVGSGYGCKEAYRFPHILIPTPLVSAVFCNNISLSAFFFILVHVCNKTA